MAKSWCIFKEFTTSLETEKECNPGVFWMLKQIHKHQSDILCTEVLKVPKCICGLFHKMLGTYYKK